MGKNGFDLVKVDKTVIKETKFIAIIVLLLSAIMQAVFLIIRRWDLSVLFGNLISALVMIGNFFFMGITPVFSFRFQSFFFVCIKRFNRVYFS